MRVQIHATGEGYCYQPVTTLVTWHEAKAVCEDKNMYLAAWTEQATYDSIHANIYPVRGDVVRAHA